LRGLFSIEVFDQRAADLDAKLRIAIAEETNQEIAQAKIHNWQSFVSENFGGYAHKLSEFIQTGDEESINQMLKVLIHQVTITSQKDDFHIEIEWEK
jgi:hypothetical protein